MNRLNVVALAVALSTGAALAHSGVQNAAVKARMDAMSEIGAKMKTLGSMAKGATAFDLPVARAAVAAIADHASKTSELFRAEETDPKSEAKPSIWTNFDDFTVKAKKLETVAKELSQTLATADELGPAMGALGATCKSCHSAYREKKS